MTEDIEAAPGLVRESTAEDVLLIGQGITLNIAGDVLVVKDKAHASQHRNRFCGIPVGASPIDTGIKLSHVLWAEIVNNSLTIDYALEKGKTSVHVAKLQYPTDNIPVNAGPRWIELLLDRAYGPAQRRKRAKVLVNPNAGPGGADKIWEQQVKPIFEAARMILDVHRTTRGAEATDICEALNLDAYDVVIPCSGDGMPYEVFNGLGKRPDAQHALKQMAVAHIPCGSGNAMSCNLNGTHRPSLAALAIVKGRPTPIDLMSITQGSTRTLSFLSQSVGIIAECDLGTENLRWLGPARFNVGIMQRIFSKKVYPCDISVKVEIQNKAEIKAHYKRERESEIDAERPIQRREGSSRETSLTGDQGSGDSSMGNGLPPLRFGTINDKIPDDWETTSYDNMGNFYCGNMAWMAPDANFFTAACPNDGLMDLVVNDGDISAKKYIGIMTSLDNGQFFDHQAISYRKVVAYRLTPRNQKSGYISIDGESVPFEPFQVEIHQGLGTAISRAGRYEAPGPLGWEKI